MQYRSVKRVPMDFDYPLNKVWHGYYFEFGTCMEVNGGCDTCKKMAQIKGIPIVEHGCPDYEGYFGEVIKTLKSLCEPPVGDGYQLWEYTSEGSPVSPVFETLDALCEWCEDNATWYEKVRICKEEWKERLQK